MNRHHPYPASMRLVLVLSLLLAFVSIEQNAAPPVAHAATPVSISAGAGNTCAVKSDGSLACWGWNEYGQATPPAGSFTQVSAGTAHTCAVKSDGSLACWGYNEHGQATPPPGTFSQVSTGEYHTCVVKSDSTVVCWGWNNNGQVMAPAGSFTQVSAGLLHTCGVKSDGTVACWGRNDDGQATPPAGSFTQVDTGGYQTCGLKSDGTLACWGRNDWGQATPPAGSFTQVSAGADHTCGLKSDGSLACWGRNDDGQATPPAGSFSQVSAGGYHTCGLKSDGTGVCWGTNGYGQAPGQVHISPADLPVVDRGAAPPALSGAGGLGGPYTFTVVSGTLPPGLSLHSDGTWMRNNPAGQGYYSFSVKVVDAVGIFGVIQHFTLPVRNTATAITDTSPNIFTVGQPAPLHYSVTPLVPGTPAGSVTVAVVQQALRFIQVSAGNEHTCGLTSDGSVACWGDDSAGRATPPAGSFSQVSAGEYHTCGLKRDSTVACWGSDGFGQAAPPAGSFSQVDAGWYHTCGVKSDGTVACWGRNQYEQATPPAGSFSQVSAGFAHTCGLKTDGTVACWGSDYGGRAAPPAGSFSQVSAGSGQTCGVMSDGSLVCWGDTSGGQGSFSQVSAGSGHTCAVKVDGTLTCWGANDFEQATPPAGSFTQVSAGYHYTCGVKGDGTLTCWGQNQAGQATPPLPPLAAITNSAETCTASVSAGGCAVPFTSVGLKYLKAIYAGNGTFTASVSALITRMVKATTTTTIASITAVGAGPTVLVRYTVAGAVQEQLVGVVTVRAGADSCTALATAGACSLAFTSAGVKSVTATYAGDVAFHSSVSAAAAYTAKAATTTTITSITPEPGGAERTVLVRYTVASAAQAQPGGMVTVRAGAESCTASATAGVCRLTFSSEELQTLTATYAGDSAFYGSVSPAVDYLKSDAEVLVFLPLVGR
jgi:alpha-tubulin suppressor-like RCC1 family protein